MSQYAKTVSVPNAGKSSVLTPEDARPPARAGPHSRRGILPLHALE